MALAVANAKPPANQLARPLVPWQIKIASKVHSVEMIHCFSVNGCRLVLDIASGALHEVDEAAYIVLKAIQGVVHESAYILSSQPEGKNSYYLAQILDIAKPENFSNTGLAPHVLKETLSEIRSLVEIGQLFTLHDETFVHEHMQNRRPVVKALCMHMAHECNLRCRYCFAGQGDYGQDRGLMSLDTGKKALDFLIDNSGVRRNLEVDFFGGEPMLNFDTVKALVAYGRTREKETGKRFRFTLTTNGALVTDDVHTYINEHMDNVVLSLDGRPEVNDKMRKLARPNQCQHTNDMSALSGSFSTVFPKIKALADARNHQNYYVRGTYTRHNLDFAADVLYLADKGFTQISVEPVVAPASADYSLRVEDLETLYHEYDKLAEALLAREKAKKGVNFFHFQMDLSGGPCLAKRVTGCGAGSEYLAVTPSGKLFPCHQFVGDDNFCLGDVDAGVSNTEMVKEFSNCHVYTKPACRGCWARYYCSGGCMATAYHTHGNINQPDEISCDLQRKRIEVALYIKAVSAGNAEDTGVSHK